MKSCTLVVLLLSLTFLAVAQDPKDIGNSLQPQVEDSAKAVIPLTVSDVAKIRAVTAAEISPDGKWVAVVTAVPRGPSEPNGRAHAELSVVSFEGSDQRVIVPAPGTLSGIQWSGDSQSVLFLGKRGDDKETRVWTVPIGGGLPTPVTPPGRAIRTFSATRDGRRLAFTEEEAEDPARVARRKAGFVHEVYEEEWRPVHVREMERQGGKTRTFEVPGSAFEIGYNASGTKLCVTAAPTPSVDDSYMRKKVYAVDCATGDVTLAIDNKGKLGNAVISADGKTAGAVIGVDEHDPHESVLALGEIGAGGDFRVLTPADYPGHVVQCGVVSVKDFTVFGALVARGVEAGIMVPSKGEDVWLVEPGVAGATSRFSSAAGRIAFVSSRAQHPPECYVFDVDAAEGNHDVVPRRLTTSNPWLNQGSLGRQEVVRWKARDGKEIEGILIHPLVKPAKTAPLIVCVHGGPEAHDVNGWLTSYSQPGQVAAGRGYYVLYPNYRSSTGRGVAFSKLGQGDLANGEFTDILDGIEALCAKGLVDETKVGITGGSYGGYLSAWAATKWSDRFAAAVVFVGVTDQVSKRLCTDIPMEDYLVHWKIWTDENQALVWDRSPIAHAKGSKTPTLICHGKDDPRVNPAQSLELYRTLKTRGAAPVRLVWYPGEGHGNQLRCSRVDYSIRMLAWFDHFLVKGAKDLPPAEVDYGDEMAVPAPGGGR